MLFVMDCSVTMPWVLHNDATGYANKVLHCFEKGEAIVPDLWFLEVSNVLLVFERRKRINVAESEQFIKLLSELPINTDQGTGNRVFSKIILLAREYQLSTYDAAYLELAVREELPLATLDKNLRRSARKSGIELFKMFHNTERT
jgi:predicted nucleic acid-binding protein